MLPTAPNRGSVASAISQGIPGSTAPVTALLQDRAVLVALLQGLTHLILEPHAQPPQTLNQFKDRETSLATSSLIYSCEVVEIKEQREAWLILGQNVILS